jgi:site-specific DNA recombinase
VARAARAMLAGVPLATVTRNLNASGKTTTTGRPWGASAVRDLLMRPRLAGLAVWRGEVVGKAKWPAIITEDEHRALVTLMTDPSRRTSTGTRASYLLSGWARCGVCDGSITSSRNATRHHYRCRPNGCVARRRDWADEYVADVIVERLSRPDARDLLVDHDQPDTAALLQQESALRVRLEDLATDYADGAIDRTQLRTGTDRIRAKLADIEASLRHTSRAPVLAELVGAANVREVWEALSLERQRAVAQALMDVKLHPGSSGFRDRDSLLPRFTEITWKE